MDKLMNFLCEAFGLFPLKWNPHLERFEKCNVRYTYSIVLFVLLAIIDPISILNLLHSVHVFDNVNIMTYVSLAEYFMSYAVLLVIMFAQNHAPEKIVYLTEEYRRLLQTIDPDRRKALERFIMKRNVLSLVIAFLGMSSNVLCLNFLQDESPPPLVVLVSCIASLPATTMTLFLVIYNTTMYVALENFQQINRRLQVVMNTLRRLTAEDGTKVGNYQKLKTFCDISDQIDALAIFHRDIFNFLGHFTSHYNSAMLLFIINVFTAVVSQSFEFYMNVAGLIRNSSTGNSWVSVDLQFSGAIFYALMTVIQLLFVIEATSAVIDIARTAGTQLHQVISECFDERLEKSIEMFSIQLLSENIKIDVCGLFNLDYELIYSIIAAATTYLIILVQFELMRPVSE